MSKEIDIFKNTDAAPKTGEFFKFATIGDGIQGTYVDRREGKDGFQNDQIIYVLKDKDGTLWNAAFRTTSVVVHERMKNAKFGYIVGFKYDSDGIIKRGVNAGKKFRIINVYFDGKTIDKDWTGSHPDANIPDVRRGDEEGDTPMRVPFPPEEESLISDSSMEAIRNLANAKKLTDDSMSEDDAIEAIINYVELPLTEETLPKVIIKLTEYKA